MPYIRLDRPDVDTMVSKHSIDRLDFDGVAGSGSGRMTLINRLANGRAIEHQSLHLHESCLSGVYSSVCVDFSH